YPEPNRSHFRSQEIWQTASTAKTPPATGWLGRAVDFLAKPADENHVLGLALSSQLPQAFQAQQVTVPVLQDLEKAAAEDTPQEGLLNRLISTASAGDNDAARFLRRQASSGYRTAEVLRKSASQFKSAVEYPGELGKQFLRAAQLITADVGVRLLYLGQPG